MATPDFIGYHKYELDTPCLVIDIDKLDSNIAIMQSLANQKGKNVRPHVKTHKCIEICKRQIAAGAIGICAAKVSEALVMAKNKVPGILITSPVVTRNKLQSLLECLSYMDDIIVVVDNINNIDALNHIMHFSNKKIGILIDIDSGIGRTGILHDKVMSFAQYIKIKSNLIFRGIQCYAGNLQHIANYHERKYASLATMQRASDTLNLLNDAGYCDLILSCSGTGTFSIDMDVSAVTEIQPGSYTVMDVEYADIGSLEDNTKFTTFSHSLTLLTTVISNNRPEHVTVDAGWKGIYVDSTKPRIISHSYLEYEWGGFGDEHGKVRAMNNKPLPALGEVIEMQIPHCDPTINLYDQFFVTKDNKVIDTWRIDMRGKSQ